VELGIDRLRVIDDVQVVVPEVDDRTSVGAAERRALDVPLERYLPVEYARARRHFVHLERDATADSAQRVSEPVAGNAAADRVELRGESEEFLPDVADSGHRQRQ